MGARIAAFVVAAALLAIAWVLPHVRHRLIADVITWDAPPSDPAALPFGDGPGLPPVAHTRVLLIDGLSADTASTLPAWSALCKRGATLTIDVGFPTVSLPVEAALWSGLTQQQTGIMYRSDRPLEPPLNGIPSQVPGSIAIAESHGYIVRSLGFAHAEPLADLRDLARDFDDGSYPDEGVAIAIGQGPNDVVLRTWEAVWRARARAAVASDAKLVFVHVLRVDTTGHKYGHDSDEYRATALEADKILETLSAADPNARWFLLSDHGHLPRGGHGGEERAVRQVQGCIVGPGVLPAVGSLVHIVDVARAIADSVGAKLDLTSRGRPLIVAMKVPLDPQQALPRTPLGSGAVAFLILIVGLGAASWGVRRWWIAPWWFVIACLTLVIVRGEPTLSMSMVYRPEGREMYVTWLPALGLAAVSTWIGLQRTTLARVVVGQLAPPFAALAAVFTVCGAWPALFGAEVAPVVPRYTAWMFALVLIVAHGASAVGLAVLGRTVRSVFGRREPLETPSNAPAAD